jgi:predicted amidophosphoribosyltransferase
MRQRGYNQAGLIAQSLAETLGYAYRGDGLVRTAASPPQAALGRRDRLNNLRGVIEPGPQGRGGAVSGRDVLVVDDVLTTGATLQACSEALLRAGARRVFGCVVATGVPTRLWEGGAHDVAVVSPQE